MRKQLTEIVKLQEPLHIKYRPTTFDAMYGQQDVVKSLRQVIANSRPHAFLFTGSSGMGKTTLARILTTELQVVASNIVEIDAASNTGIDAMREVLAPVRYHGFGDTPNKAIIVDEAHMLSKAAWASLLKTVEEPPDHVFFFFCTTDAGKVPENIVTRCLSYVLRPVQYDDIMDLLEFVCKSEGNNVPDAFLPLVARACNGSPRWALVMLATIQNCEDTAEVSRLLELPMENKEIIDLCRELVKGQLTWERLCKTLKAMPEVSAESIRIVVVNYLNSCLLGARNDKEAMRLLDILSCFTKPCLTSDKLAPVLLAFGTYIFP